MPAYGIPQSGSNSDPTKNLTSLSPGDVFVMWSGTETPAQGMASVAFARGYNPGGGMAPTTFYLSGMPAASVVQVQGADDDIDGSYYVLSELSPDTNGNAAYTDTGTPGFYRLRLKTYVSGTMPRGKAGR